MNVLTTQGQTGIPGYCLPDLSKTGTVAQTVAITALLLAALGIALILMRKSKRAALAAPLALALVAVGINMPDQANASTPKTCPKGYHYEASLDPDNQKAPQKHGAHQQAGTKEPAQTPATSPEIKPAPSPEPNGTKKPATPKPGTKPAPGQTSEQPSPKPLPAPAKPGKPQPRPEDNPLAGKVLIVSDANRDGKANPEDPADQNPAAATATSGAVFLANLDDSAKRCPLKNKAGKPLELEELRTCSDANDTEINGAEDLKDLAPLTIKAIPTISEQGSGKIKLDAASQKKVNLFINRNGKWEHLKEGQSLSAKELRQNVQLRLEGIDVVKDQSWDGHVTVTLEVTDGGHRATSQAHLKAAPLITQNHLQKLQTLYTLTKRSGHFSGRLTSEIAGLASKAAFKAQPFGDSREVWVQDSFEPMYQVMPTENGPRIMRVMLKTDQVRGVYTYEDRPNEKPDATDKTSIYQALYGLRGPGVGILDIGKRQANYTLDSGGNIETLPPMPGYPAGRILMGKRTAANIPADAEENEPLEPSESIRDFFTAQKVQKPIYLDTSFLSVGHIDEMITTVPANTKLGWKLVVSSPQAGLEIFKKLQAEGHGKEQLMSHEGAQGNTIDGALEKGRADWVNGNAERIIQKNIDIIKKETGITDADIIRVPVFYRAEVDDDDPNGVNLDAKTYAADFIPNAVNGVVANNKTFIAPRQFGPVIGGKDLYQEAVEKAFAQAGMKVLYADTYRTLYVHGGELHCGTNAIREATPYFLKGASEANPTAGK
ncbi:hypothetical protein BSR29_02390 [Boudabousia liubingyangii]|uniref:Protein-arginine deiminase C-terminal domain-containing protein n=1 Tax=Boudabousia liubingyangii TaxID=1921764 RepID=A0A1Q5PQK8_9ACTO|nr:protein-arginine deiminase family protein [Boudabousia liubingyangii]OKL49816.1 hypothetical protein BSR29_02390 [Boudabousia liubingyangii]